MRESLEPSQSDFRCVSVADDVTGWQMHKPPAGVGDPRPALI